MFLFPNTLNIVIIAENIYNEEEYRKIVEKDVQEIRTRKNKNFIERFFNQEENIEKLFFIEDLFAKALHKQSVSRFIHQAVYRLKFYIENEFYLVYTFIEPPFSLLRHFIIFTIE